MSIAAPQHLIITSPSQAPPDYHCADHRYLGVRSSDVHRWGNAGCSAACGLPAHFLSGYPVADHFTREP
jgi:hypothetical protein